IALAVADWPVPALTGTRPPMRSTAVRNRTSNSASNSAAASPVEPATTTAWVPPPSCRSISRCQASRSSSPSTSKGVASAVMLPVGRKSGGLRYGERSAMGAAAGRADVTCGAKARASMLPAAPLRSRNAVQLRAMRELRIGPEPVPTFAGAALTDPIPRPSPNENHLLINAYSTHPDSPLLPISRRVTESGCNLVDARLSTVGRDVSVTALAMGSWDAIAKLEAMLTRLEREDNIKLNWYRTGEKQVQADLLPYIVEVV